MLGAGAGAGRLTPPARAALASAPPPHLAPGGVGGGGGGVGRMCTNPSPTLALWDLGGARVGRKLTSSTRLTQMPRATLGGEAKV